MQFEFRCKNCGKLLYKGEIIAGDIEIMCNKCKHMNYVRKILPIQIPKEWLGIEFIKDK